ncbi:hypothetical protein LINGRAHAP2_LOCUS34669, partial [Linum grandiflorum]
NCSPTLLRQTDIVTAFFGSGLRPPPSIFFLTQRSPPIGTMVDIFVQPELVPVPTDGGTQRDNN